MLHHRIALAGALTVGLFAGLRESTACDTPVVPETQKRPVDLVICLDTSGSMQGLIESAKQKLWGIVNDLALAEPTPELRVALLTYGNDGHNPENGWVNIESGLTEDLDLISQKLFALTTNGGTELVARVIHNSLTKLAWHPSADALKLIVVAGNESADQDREMPFREVCKQTISQGIMINSIYCHYNSDDPTVELGWREVAKLADGQYAAIDHDNGTVVIATPFDDQLADLSTATNATYIPIGTNGQRAWANQTAQDANAASLNSAAAASRAQTKGSAIYVCSWDLVDAFNLKNLKIEDVKKEDLPENMQEMTVQERTAYVNEMSQKRAGIRKQINELNDKRLAFITEEMKKQNLDDSKSFDNAIRKAVREQAAAKGFTFKEKTASADDKQGEKTESGTKESASG